MFLFLFISLALADLSIPLKRNGPTLIEHVRHLKSLSLKDSQLINHGGVIPIKAFYTGNVWIGTPPQEFSLILDTTGLVTKK